MLGQLSEKHLRAPNSSKEALGKAGVSSQEWTASQGKMEGETRKTSGDAERPCPLAPAFILPFTRALIILSVWSLF